MIRKGTRVRVLFWNETGVVSHIRKYGDTKICFIDYDYESDDFANHGAIPVTSLEREDKKKK